MQILSLLKSKKFLILLAILFISFIINRSISFIINWSKYNAPISETLQTFFDAKNVTIGGNTTGNILKKQIKIQNITIIYADKDGTTNETSLIKEIIASVSMGSIFSKNIKINKISLIGPNLQINQVQKLYTTNTGNDTEMIPILIKNGELRPDNENILYQFETLKNINGKITHQDNLNYNISLSFNLKNQNYNIDLQSAGDDSEIEKSFELSSNITSIQFNSQTIINNGESETSGKIKGSGKSLTKFLNDISFYSSNNNMQDIEEEDKWEMQSAISGKNNSIIIENLSIESSAIKGSMVINKNHSSNIEITEIITQIEHINLDKLSLAYNNPGNNKNNKLISGCQISIPQNLSMLFSTKIDKIIYKNFNFHSFQADADLSNGEITVYSSKLKMQDNAEINFKGITTHNNIRPKLEGTIEAQGKNLQNISQALFDVKIPNTNMPFTFKSDIIISPFIVKLSNTFINGYNLDVDGNMKYKWGKNNNQILGDIHFKLLNYNLYQQKSHDSLFANYQLNKSDFLKNLNIDLKLEISCDELLINNQQIKNVKFNIETQNNTTIIDEINLYSPTIHLGGKIKFISSALQPLMYVELNSRYINHTTKEKTNQNKKNNNNIFWKNKKIEFFGLDKLQGNIKLDLKNITLDEIKINNILFDGDFRSGSIKINTFLANLYGGDANIKGAIGMRKNIISNIAASISNMNLAQINKTLFDTQNIKSGTISISCSLSSYGGTTHEIINRLKGSANVAVRNSNINGFDIDMLADNIFNAKNNDEIIDIADKALYSGVTNIKSFDGQSNIKKGILSIRSKIFTKRTGGSLVANIDLLRMLINGAARFLFIPNPDTAEAVSADMTIKGIISHPQRTFNTEALSQLVLMGVNTLRR